ncbi:MAG: DUF3368 domain-containing protein [Desulfococcaceae bacterium]
MNKKVIIADSSPLIGLALIGQLELLPGLYSKIIIPSSVWNEMTVEGKGLPGAEEISRIRWFEIRNPEKSVSAPLTILLDRGEADAIALAIMLPEAIVLLDDSRARKIAKRLNIKHIGTVGLLRRAKKSGLIDELRPYLESLQAKGIYISDKLISAVLADVGEK